MIERRRHVDKELEEIAEAIKLGFDREHRMDWIKAAKECYGLSERESVYLMYQAGVFHDRRGIVGSIVMLAVGVAVIVSILVTKMIGRS